MHTNSLSSKGVSGRSKPRRRFPLWTRSLIDVRGSIAVTVVAVDRAGNASAPSDAIHGSTNWSPETDCGR